MMQRGQNTRFGFTIIELAAVLFIIGTLAALLFPAIGAMTRNTRASAAENAIHTGVIAARAYATREKTIFYLDDASVIQPAIYSGAAILFTPVGEMRIVENVGLAYDDGNPLERQDLNGYDDIPNRDYVLMPEDFGVMGIRRGMSSSPELILLPPPFAVRFDENGHLVAGGEFDDVDRNVYYDSNYDGIYKVSMSRFHPNKYDPRNWDPQTNSMFAQIGKNTNNQRWLLPFEQIETVIGVLVYNKVMFNSAALEIVGSGMPAEFRLPDNDGSLQGNSDRKLGKWLLENGNPLFFSRYSGTLMR